ncbi:MAG TPA: hypothetical protein VGH42_05580 [Verrucomicrobiae bacterium]
MQSWPDWAWQRVERGNGQWAKGKGTTLEAMAGKRAPAIVS